MTRSELAAYLTNTYSTAGENLFARYPGFQVFRHNGNRKWFAAFMDGKRPYQIVMLVLLTAIIGLIVVIALRKLFFNF